MKDYSEIISTLRLANSWQFAPGYVAAMLAAADAIEELQEDYDTIAKMYEKANEDLTELREAQRWISVKDRLPDTIPCNAGTEYSEAVVVLTEDRIVCTAIWNGETWIGDFDYWEADWRTVTHWKSVLPLPELPEVEDANT